MKQHLLIALALLVTTNCLHAQVAVPSSGGEGQGAGGTCSFSIGQVDYTSINGEFSLSQGVQQTFRSAKANAKNIWITPTIAAAVNSFMPLVPVAITAVAYPNPTANKIVLSLDNVTFNNLGYVLYDMKGHPVLNAPILQRQTTISLQFLAGGFYMLKVNQNSTELKSIKIIKE